MRARGVEVVDGLDAVVCDDDWICDVVLPKGAERERLVVRVVLDEQDRSHCVHASSSRVRPGSVKWILAPPPTSPSAQTRPPWRSTILFTVASPMPVPVNSAAGWS